MELSRHVLVSAISSGVLRTFGQRSYRLLAARVGLSGGKLGGKKRGALLWLAIITANASTRDRRSPPRYCRSKHYIKRMGTAAYRSELEEARILLGEGLLRLWEQAELIDALLVAGKSTEKAKDLLLCMQKTVDELVRKIKSIVEQTG